MIGKCVLRVNFRVKNITQFRFQVGNDGEPESNWPPEPDNIDSFPVLQDKKTCIQYLVGDKVTQFIFRGATNAVNWTAFIVIARYPGVKGGFARALRRAVVDRGQSGNQRSAVLVRAWQ